VGGEWTVGERRVVVTGVGLQKGWMREDGSTGVDKRGVGGSFSFRRESRKKKLQKSKVANRNRGSL